MKLIIVLSITDYKKQVIKILDTAGIKRFSTLDITGYKKRKENATLNWFGTEIQEVKTNSILLFSFAPKEVADRVVKEFDRCNEDNPTPFPVHAFVLDVEQYSKLL